MFRFASATRHDPAIDEWLSGEPWELHALAREWFAQFRQCGADVNELIHDGDEKLRKEARELLAKIA